MHSEDLVVSGVSIQALKSALYFPEEGRVHALKSSSCAWDCDRAG